MRLIYLSHPEVEIDPRRPAAQWRLSEVGRGRIVAAAAAGWPGRPRVACSAEPKAREAAEILAAGAEVLIVPGLGELDRSATGYLPAPQYEALVERAFAFPDEAVHGWEPVRQAQARAVDALQSLLSGGGDLLVVGHGGVGTLTWCHLAGRPIDRAHDQPGLGSVWQAEGPEFRPQAEWVTLEAALAEWKRG